MNMKRSSKIFRPIALISIGLLLALSSAAASLPVIHGENLSAVVLQVTKTPAAKAVSEVGSTDWITMVSIVIVLIILVPIFALRKSWDR